MAERSPAALELYYTSIVLTLYKNRTNAKSWWVSTFHTGFSSSKDKGYGGTSKRPAHPIWGLVRLTMVKEQKVGKEQKICNVVNVETVTRKCIVKTTVNLQGSQVVCWRQCKLGISPNTTRLKKSLNSWASARRRNDENCLLENQNQSWFLSNGRCHTLVLIRQNQTNKYLLRSCNKICGISFPSPIPSFKF